MELTFRSNAAVGSYYRECSSVRCQALGWFWLAGSSEKRGSAARQALADAAKRGTNVVLLLQGRVEYAMLYYALRALYTKLLEGGVRIFEYHASFLHAKVGVIDGNWATVGSSNIDPFSLLLSREANVIVRNEAFADRLRASLQNAMSLGARELRPADWDRVTRAHRALSWLAFGFVRMVMGVLGVWR